MKFSNVSKVIICLICFLSIALPVFGENPWDADGTNFNKKPLLDSMVVDLKDDQPMIMKAASYNNWYDHLVISITIRIASWYYSGKYSDSNQLQIKKERIIKKREQISNNYNVKQTN